jgi:short-subunit dehydrogenase
MPLIQGSKKKVLITGASSGIGLATTQQLLNEGHSVVAIARDFSKSNIQHKNLFTIEIDLSKLDTLPQKLNGLLKQHSTINATVFCAGKGLFGSLEELSHQQIHQLMDLNFHSQVYLTKALVPLMKQNKAGDLIYIGSEAALRAGKKGTIYCASKFALRGFVLSLREECASAGIRVCLVNPGMVQTPFFDELNFKPGAENNQALIPDDIAKTISMVLSSRSGAVFDEINLSPQKHVIEFLGDK